MTQLTFYDAANAANVPVGAGAFAGYVDGRFRSLAPMRRQNPNALWLSICVAVSSQAMVLDVESGDASPGAAAEWIQAMHQRNVSRPVIYCSLATVPAVELETRALNIQRNQWRLWTAHWTGRAHICTNACGTPMVQEPGATQYQNDEQHGFDVSLTSLEWFHAVRHDYLERRIP